MRRSKSEAIDAIKRNKVIVIARKVPTEKIIEVCRALYDGGLCLIEITFDQSNPKCIEETTKAISMIKSEFKDKVYVGAGTVLSIEQVNSAAAAGAEYIISPNTDKAVIERTNECGLVSIPGACTPTEIVLAYNCGADFIKIFPSDTIGIAGIKALVGPLGHIPMLAVGGIDENNLFDFLSFGICGVGVGSNILKKELLESNDFEEIKTMALKFSGIGDKIK